MIIVKSNLYISTTINIISLIVGYLAYTERINKLFMILTLLGLVVGISIFLKGILNDDRFEIELI